VLTDAFGEEAISADKAIASAAEAVQNILTITAANLNAQLAVLSASSAVVNDIRDRVARGQVITIHASPVTRRAWTGTGYIARNPTTGETAYLLTQGELVLSGGLTIVAPADWVDQALVNLLSNPDGPRSVGIEDVPPGAAGFVELLDPLSQVGTVGEVAPLAFVARVVLLDGSVVSGAEVEFVSERGRPRCFATESEASAFAASLTSAPGGRNGRGEFGAERAVRPRDRHQQPPRHWGRALRRVTLIERLFLSIQPALVLTERHVRERQ
jgi:hypothetical protein